MSIHNNTTAARTPAPSQRHTPAYTPRDVNSNSKPTSQTPAAAAVQPLRSQVQDRDVTSVNFGPDSERANAVLDRSEMQDVEQEDDDDDVISGTPPAKKVT